MSPYVVKVLSHLGKLALLGAGVAVLGALLSLAAGFNPLVLPVFYQGVATALLPLIYASIKSAQAELAAELATEAAKEAQAKAVTAQDELALLKSTSAPSTKTTKTKPPSA